MVVGTYESLNLEIEERKKVLALLVKFKARFGIWAHISSVNEPRYTLPKECSTPDILRRFLANTTPVYSAAHNPKFKSPKNKIDIHTSEIRGTTLTLSTTIGLIEFRIDTKKLQLLNCKVEGYWEKAMPVGDFIDTEYLGGSHCYTPRFRYTNSSLVKLLTPILNTL